MGFEFDICVFLTATDIFRSPAWISEAVNALLQDETLESAFAVHKTTKLLHKDEFGKWNRLLPWMRNYSNRQIRSAIYREDTGLASASRSWLWREGRRIGDKNHMIINDDFEKLYRYTYQIDLYIAEAAIKYFKENGQNKYKFITDYEV